MRVVSARVRLKRLGREELEAYLAAGAWRGRACGLSAEGMGGAFVRGVNGAWGAVEGFPSREVMALLIGSGWRASVDKRV